MRVSWLVLISVGLMLPIVGVAQKKVKVIEQEQTLKNNDEKVIKRKVAIGRFSNETQYSKGLFYDKENDPMGKQALDILSSKLASSNKFILLERSDLSSLEEEAKKGGNSSQTIGADYLIIGSVTEFGRKNVGNSRVFTSSKTQTVEAAVSIRLVDVSTGLIIYSDEAKGSAEITTKTTMGLGGKADYDATLSDKAISAAIGQLVENIINKCTNKPWRSYFLAYDNDVILISGGKSQGLEVGNKFLVKKKGKSVKNPQTGLMIDLPGKDVGEVEIVSSAGDTPESEYSIVKFVSGNIEKENLGDYFIEEEK